MMPGFNQYSYIIFFFFSYTGAPFFSAIAATVLGADMSHVICERNAGTVIKTYSPNLMVHPYLLDSSSIDITNRSDSIEKTLKKVNSLLDRVHVVVVGPGLGRDEVLLETATKIIEEVRRRSMPIVIDADGLYLVQNNPDVIKGYKNAVLTPNVVEFKRLKSAVGLPESSTVKELAIKFGGLTILEKGREDLISNGTTTLKSKVHGGLKRVSGQGDTLSGTLATFLAWKLAFQNNLWEHKDESISEEDLFLLAAYGASTITRHASRKAFELHGRGVLTSHISDQVGTAYADLFEPLVKQSNI